LQNKTPAAPAERKRGAFPFRNAKRRAKFALLFALEPGNAGRRGGGVGLEKSKPFPVFQVFQNGESARGEKPF